MSGQSYFQLISPLIFLVFSLGFAGIYYIAREQVSARMFALSYLFGAIGFLLDFFRSDFPGPLNHVPSNVSYMITAATFALALTRHYTGRAHWRRIGVLFVLSLSFLSYFAFYENNIIKLAVSLNLCGMLMFGYPLGPLRKIEKRAIDMAIYVLTVIMAAQFPIRTGLVLWIEGDDLTPQNYTDSIFALTLQFTASVAALFMAMSLFLMFGMDIMLRLRKTSETDLLTGLCNRRGLESARDRFEDAFELGIGRHSVLVIDIDHFKKVNDTWGHDAGDQVLRRCATVLERMQTDCSFAARIGGEEFHVILYNTDVDAAKTAAEYACSVFRSLLHPEMGNKPVTVSIGIAVWTQEVGLTDTVRHGDHALYRAKSEGRDRVCVAGPTKPAGQIYQFQRVAP